jgi:hypothetical protein
MARYQILAMMMTVPKPMMIAEADTPQDAVRKAREFEKSGRRELQIGDTQAEQYYPLAEFASQHGIR